jgi:lipopolysaccharide/colanic/teichoic acid biosynthesis glycosyltransferase
MPDGDIFALPPTHPGYDQLKRALDITFALVVFVVLSPLWLAIACVVKLTSPGPVLFSRIVVGRYGNRLVFKGV